MRVLRSLLACCGYAVSWLLATPWTPTTEAALELARQRKGYGAC